VAGSCEGGNEPLGFHKRRETSLPAERLSAFQDVIRGMELAASEAERGCLLVKKSRG
jgi:hypothetical protein